jgi:ABC-2 type transport system permease protein
VASAGLSPQLVSKLKKSTSVSIVSPAGYIGLCFLFFVLAISLFCCYQMSSARREEAEERLQMVLCLPVGRTRWLSGRLALAVAGSALLALSCGLCAWAGAGVEGADVSLVTMLEAAVNCLPASLLFLSLAAAAFALVPRTASAIGYGIVAVAFLWQLFGGLLGAPQWLLEATPFAHIGLAPAQPVRVVAAAVMLAIAAVVASAAVGVFARRDLIGH